MSMDRSSETAVSRLSAREAQAVSPRHTVDLRKETNAAADSHGS